MIMSEADRAPPPAAAPPPPSEIFNLSSFEFPGRRTRGGGTGGFASSATGAAAVAGGGGGPGPEEASAATATAPSPLGVLVRALGLSGGVLKSTAAAEASDLTRGCLMHTLTQQEKAKCVSHFQLY